MSDHHSLRWIHWRPDALEVDLMIDRNGHVSLQSLRPSGTGAGTDAFDSNTELSHALPLAQIRLLGEGSTYGTSERLVFSAASERLVYVQHKQWKHDEEEVEYLEVSMKDRTNGMNVRHLMSVYTGIPVLRSRTIVENDGDKDISLQVVAALSLGYINRGSDEWWKTYEVGIANSTNFREAQWKTFQLADLGMDYVGSSDFHQPGTRACIAKSNLGTMSTCGSLLMGHLSRKDGKQCYMWQIEHSGPWKWELGNILKGMYLIAGGPNDQDHQWTKALAPGKEFSSVSTALAVVPGIPEDAFAAFTRYRRRIRRIHADNKYLPIIFNDYMNCLDGDPTEKKVLDLIGPARRAGAEYFCIDAGWYADVTDWWASVGAWQPSTIRFPHGLKNVLGKIRSAGMKSGLWLEPEVVGIESLVANQLPDEAFFQRRGRRIVEQRRYHLDFRCTSVTDRMDGIIHSLVEDFGVQYFKFDYNIDVTQGNDNNASSPGDGLLEHHRAYMAWINRIYDRFPEVIIESCSSGGQRLDYSILATHSIQSTSDQTDPVLYSAISANILTALTPEQSASWALPQPHYSNDLIALCMVNSLMGRLYISGRVDLLNEEQMQLVIEASELFKSIRTEIPKSVPFWPLSLHAWHQEWLVLGLRSAAACYLAVWRRGGRDTCCIPLPELRGEPQLKTIYPESFVTTLRWDNETRKLVVRIPVAPSARVFSIG